MKNTTRTALYGTVIEATINALGDAEIYVIYQGKAHTITIQEGIADDNTPAVRIVAPCSDVRVLKCNTVYSKGVKKVDDRMIPDGTLER